LTHWLVIHYPAFVEKILTMHELSLALEVVDLASREAEKNRIATILEIMIEVGNLSGVEADAFEMVLGWVAKDTILENTDKQVIRIPGKGLCANCDLEFEMKQILDTCPECNSYPVEIRGGREFRVVSIVGE
jgi:hydrogenase nickel incorporation protein HypA/HybF